MITLPHTTSAALSELMGRATAAMYERLGARLNDPSLTEAAVARDGPGRVDPGGRGGEGPADGEQQRRLVRDVSDDVLGHGPLQRLLDDVDVTEIMVNGYDTVYIERAGKITLSGVKFTSEDHLRKIIERIVSKVGRRIDESSPMVDARLGDGSRVNAIIAPLAYSGSTLTIRKFAREPFTVNDLIRMGTMTDEMAMLLKACVEAKLNIIVSGGTGSGKTTLLNVLSSFIPEHERIITIEDAIELQLQQEHVVQLESRPANMEGKGEVNIRDLVRNSLRMRPDRIVVGEVRGGESLDMLQAMNTGHEGSLSTVHANSPRDAMSRLETLVLMAGMDLPLRAIREQAASAIDVVVQLSRLRDGSRRIVSVTEVQGMEGQTVTMQDAFIFDYAAGVDEAGRFRGRRSRPGCARASPSGSRNWASRCPRRSSGARDDATYCDLGRDRAGRAGAGVIVYLIISPGPTRLALSRRRPGAAPEASLLTRATAAVTRVIDRFLSKRGNADLDVGAAGTGRDPVASAGLLPDPARGHDGGRGGRCAGRWDCAGAGAPGAGAGDHQGGHLHHDLASAAGLRRSAPRCDAGDGGQPAGRSLAVAGAGQSSPKRHRLRCRRSSPGWSTRPGWAATSGWRWKRPLPGWTART